jgi:cysteine desulfurase/selenocysteine lyase
MTINKNLPNIPKRGHPDQYGIDLPQSSYLDPQNISRMANEIYQEVPVPEGTPELSEADKLMNPNSFAGMSVVPPAPGPMQLVHLPGQIHTYRDGTTFEAADPASHLYLGETGIPDISNLAFGVLGSLTSENSLNRLYFLGDDPRTATLLPDPTDWDILKDMDDVPVSSFPATQARTPPGISQPIPVQHENYTLPAMQSQNPGIFDVYRARNDFPALQQNVNGKPLIWLDNAATTQKPQHVIDTLSYYYEHDNSNVHRGAHTLAGRATDGYEGAREKVARFIGAESVDEIVFVRGATEAVNLVAFAWGPDQLEEGDEIIISELEHHSNIVPWQFLRDSMGIELNVIPMNDDGELRLDEYSRMLNPRTKLVAVTQVSNALGTHVSVEQIAAMAHSVGARVLVDGAQSVPHFKVNVTAMDADFFVLSGHKMFGPTGIGALYAKKEILEEMPPWQRGGSMVDQVTFENTTFNPPPAKFEAGTPSIVDAIGLGAAIDYLNSLPFEAAMLHEQSLLHYAVYALPTVPGLKIIGNPMHRVGSISLIMEDIETQKLGEFLDSEGIAVRASHHCAQPALSHYGLIETVRPSLAFYNTHEEIDILVRALHKARRELASGAGPPPRLETG